MAKDIAKTSKPDPKTYTTDFIKSDLENMTFLGNPHIDALTHSLQALGAEVWTARRRLYVIEALMARKIAVTPESIQAYMPTAEEEQQWKADRDRMIATVNAPFLRSGDVVFPSDKAFSYDPHKEPEIARRPKSEISK
ncbi:hypothetical protein [Povalibacter sp.]|uniref:hypothetical protein n=1 Tax=Povalibacter sp. TaxID=1962978 RepID=UPI002F409DE9